MATKKTADSMVNVANAIRNSDPGLRAALPVATAENAAAYFKPILEYVPVHNAFLDALVNKIYMQLFRNRSFRNPLASLKKGTSPLGSTIEEIHVNPAQAKQYNPTAETLLKQTPPDVATAYYTLNRQDVYPLTITRRDEEQAFTTWEAVGNMMEANVNALYSGNYIDEFNLMLGAFNGSLQNDGITVQQVTAPTDVSTAKALVSRMRALNRRFQLPSTKFNAFSQVDTQSRTPRTTWCRPEDIVVVITADTEALIDIEVLAQAFNIDRAEFIANQVIVIDSFGENSPIQAAMIDRAFINVWDNLYLAEPFRNPETLSNTYFLHVWQTYGCSPFANAVAFVSSTGTYTVTAEQPDDWAANYTSYYTKSGTVYPVYTPVPEGEAAPTWKANTYYSKS